MTEADLSELEGAVEVALSTKKPLQDVSLDDISLPALGPRLRALGDEVVHGRGFQLIRGLPVERWSREESVAAYWVMGLHWGAAKSNNKKGHLVGHIKDLGQDPSDPNTRLYATSAAQPYHNDGPADVVTLLCLQNAGTGGVSHWSSSHSVFNEVLRRRPDLAEVLAGPWFFDRKGEVPPGKKGFFEIPVFNYYKNFLSVNFSSNYFLQSQRHVEVPRLTAAHVEAIEIFESLASSDALRMDYTLTPGDIQILSNHTCLHARSAFTDHPDPDQRRHLLRLWLAPANERPLPPCYAEIMGGSVEVGKRGGIVCDGTVPHITPEAE